MNRVFLTAIFLFIFTSFMYLNAQWAKTYGGIGVDWLKSFQQTSDGGYIVAGTTSSFGAGYRDIWILKLSSTGEIEWQKTYGGSEWDEAYSIQQTSDRGYIVMGKYSAFGNEGGDIWILKLTSDGEIEWQKTYGDVARSIQQTMDKGYIFANGTNVLKLSSDGEIEWQKTYGGSDTYSASSIKQTNDGGYIVAGWTSSFGAGKTDIWILKLSPAGNIEWQKAYGGSEDEEVNSFQQTNDGGYIAAGRTESFGAGENDFWILRLTSVGDIEWQKTYEGSYTYSASSIKQTNDGGYIVAGWTSSFGAGKTDIWICKFTSDGDIEWQKTYGGSEWDEAYSIQQTIDGGYIVTGSTETIKDPPCNNYDSLILKLSSTGDIEWQKTYGGTYSEDEVHFIQQTSDEGYIVAGHTNSWGAYEEIWILKLLSNGNINPGCAFIKSSNAEVLDTNIMPEDTEITPEDTDMIPEDTDITPQDTNITAQNSDANVYNLGSETCTLTLSASSEGTTDPAPGSHTYATGTKVTLKAIPSGKYEFHSWSGHIDCFKSPVTITMDGDKSIEARFYDPSLHKWGGGGDGCFIAETVYGSPLHPYVKILRDFRERYLMPNKFGRSLVNLYYKYSPFAADLISRHKALKVSVRVNLFPLVIFSYLMVHLGPIITVIILVFIFMLPIFLISFFRRRISRAEAKSPIKALASRF